MTACNKNKYCNLSILFKLSPDYSSERKVIHMARSTLIRTQLRLSLDSGIHPTTGNIIFKTKSFSNVKTDANADQLIAVAEALAGLQIHPLYAVERYDYSSITS